MAITTVWDTDFEGGVISPWNQQKCHDWQQIIVSSGEASPTGNGGPAPTARNGSKMLRFERRNTDFVPGECVTVDNSARNEILTPTGYLTTDGRDNWIGISMYMPSAWDPVGECFVLQIHGGSRPGDSAVPVLVIEAQTSQWSGFYNNGTTPVDLFPSDFAMTKNHWTDWVIQYRPSTGSGGLIKVWCDGTLKTTINGPNRPSGLNPYLKTGMAFEPSSSGILIQFRDSIKIALANAGEDAYSTVDPGAGTPPGQLETPIIDPPGGDFYPSVEVSFSSPDNPDEFYYTLDGSTPTTGSTAYNDTPFTLTATTTVKVIAVKSGWADSEVATATFTLSSVSTLQAPTFDPPGGSFDPSVEVALSSLENPDEFYYTLDGSTPTTSSTPYNDTPFTLVVTTTVKAICVKSGWTDSPVAEATFTRLLIPTPSKPTGVIISFD